MKQCITYMLEVGRKFCVTLQHCTKCDEDIKNRSLGHILQFHGIFNIKASKNVSD